MDVLASRQDSGFSTSVLNKSLGDHMLPLIKPSMARKSFFFYSFVYRCLHLLITLYLEISILVYLDFYQEYNPSVINNFLSSLPKDVSTFQRMVSHFKQVIALPFYLALNYKIWRNYTLSWHLIINNFYVSYYSVSSPG